MPPPIPRESLELDDVSDVQPKPKRKRKNIDYTTLRPNNKLTPDLIASIHRDLARCISLRSILNKSLVGHTIFAAWKNKGEDYLINEGPEPHAIYGALVLAMRQALGKRDSRIERQVAEPGNPNHRQFLTIAERLIPQVWDKQVVSGSEEVVNPDDRFL